MSEIIQTQRQWMERRRREVRRLVYRELGKAGGRLSNVQLAECLGLHPRGLHHYLRGLEADVRKLILPHPDGHKRSVVWYELIDHEEQES